MPNPIPFVVLTCLMSLLPGGLQAFSAKTGYQPLVQEIGDISGDFMVAIRETVDVRPFDKDRDATQTPIIFHGGLVFQEDGNLQGLRQAERQAIIDAYQAGQVIVLIEASAHDIHALHALLDEGMALRSDTDPVNHAYLLRKRRGIPEAVVLTWFRDPLAGSTSQQALSETRQRAVDVIVRSLREEPFVLEWSDEGVIFPTKQGGLGDAVNWGSSPVQSTLLLSNTPAGIYNTSLAVYALHECDTGLDKYVVTAEADWTPVQARYQSASSSPYPPFSNDLYLDGSQQLVIDWHDSKVDCTAGTELVLRNTVCRYTNYPLRYRLEILPPRSVEVFQVRAAPAATQGTATSYTSGMTFSIAGNVNVSGNGPSAGIQAGVSWNNSSTVNVPALLVQAGDIGNEGTFWNFVYCTSGNAGSDCVSQVQMKGGGICQDYQIGDPQNGQTPNGKLSATGQSVQFASPASARSGDTFDIDVNFTVDLATTTTNLWYGSFHRENPFGIPCLATGVGPKGYCNCFGCDCGTRTEINPLKLHAAFRVPYPSTQCTPGQRTKTE